jgi:UDP-glucose 4-epimerase
MGNRKKTINGDSFLIEGCAMAASVKKILVLGGNGFIGRHVVREFLEHGLAVRIFDRPRSSAVTMPNRNENLQTIAGDFLNKMDLLRALEGISTVVHLISTTVPQNSFENPVHDVETNLVGTLRLLEAMREQGVRRILFISSGGAVYGEPEYLPIDERHPTNPIVPYGISKLAIEKFLLMAAHTEELNPTILRVSNPYGDGQRIEKAQGVLTLFLYRALAGLPLEIWGDGEVRRDFLYVGDVAKAFVKALGYSGPERIMNIGSGGGMSINEMVQKISEITGCKAQVTRKPARCFDTPTSLLCNGLAKKELAWEPQVSINEGIQIAADWLRKKLL